jgi:hypothetical protein
VVTNKALSGSALWLFMCGRGIHEKVYGQLKSAFAFDCVPTMRYAANSARDAIARVSTHPARRIDELTPHGWKSSLITSPA